MMTRDDLDPAMPDFDRLMTTWFDAEARVHEPDDLLDRTILRTSRARPRPAWLLPERWIPMELTMRRMPLLGIARYAALAVVLILLAALAIAIVGSQRRVPAPFGLAANGAIVFATASGDIATIDPATGVTKTVVGGPEADRAPAFSRDGERIAFVRGVPGGDAVYVADASGGRLVRLTKAALATVPGPNWSGDGSMLAFVSMNRLYIARTDGSGADRVDLGDISTIVDQTWRPPGGRDLIVAGVQDGKTRLFLTKLDGNGIKRISPFDGGADDFQWVTASPDGRRVAYGAFPAKQLHIVAIDQGTDDVFKPDDGIGLNFPRWSPDGTRIAVLQVPDPDANGATPATHIGVITVGDASSHVTTTGPPFSGGVQFEWSPDGTTILANQWETDEVWLLDPAGGAGTKTTWRATFDWVEWQRLAR
jgi:Tol biopolymer transport system component